MELAIGIKRTEEDFVSDKNTAKAAASGAMDVYGTPFMIALMEAASKNCVQDYLGEGQSTVGTVVNVKHVSATPVGMRVFAEAELTEVNGRMLTFRVAAYDECGLIGEGLHERAMINVAKFTAKAAAKSKETT